MSSVVDFGAVLNIFWKKNFFDIALRRLRRSMQIFHFDVDLRSLRRAMSKFFFYVTLRRLRRST